MSTTMALPPTFDHRVWIASGETILDRYTYVEPVGEGRISMILKVVDRDGAAWVVKTIKPAIREISTRHDFAGLMAVTDREARMQSSFHHPNIVQVAEYGFDPCLGMCIVLEYAPCGSLRQRLNRQTIEIPQALAIVDALLCALITLHAPTLTHPLGVVHLDLEAKNIVFGVGDIPKICDFHYARRISSPPDPADFIDDNHRIEVQTDLRQIRNLLCEMVGMPQALRQWGETRYSSALEARQALELIR